VADVEPIVVTLSQDLADLVPLFLAQRKADLAALSVAIPAADFVAIRRVGHGMAGAGASYGLDRFSVLGEQLVTAARAGDTSAVDRLKQEVEDYIARLVINYM
jgi:HPt (histidine-containing phosphotransfer) domain-containing protein